MDIAQPEKCRALILSLQRQPLRPAPSPFQRAYGMRTTVLASPCTPVQPHPIETRDILGIPVVAALPDEAVAILDEALAAGPPVLVAFLNAHGSNIAAEDPGFAAVLRRALVLNDGVGMDIAARLLHGAPFPANLNGTDFVPAYLAATQHRFRIHVVGGAAGVARRAVDALRRIAPQHRYVGARDGYFADDAAAAAAAIASGADLVLVGMGSPRQELWAARHLVVPGGVSAFCVGGLLDFIASEKPRAPALVRRLRLEWAFRLLIEPRRLWRRYLIGNAVFFMHLFDARLRRRQG